MKTLIKNATLVLPGGLANSSLMIEGTKIAALDVASHTVADQVIDGTGKFLLPGIIDDQVHFREPGLTDKEDLEHASRACAKGGVTSFLEMPNTIPNTITQSILNDKLKLAETRSLVNFGFYIGATVDNVDELAHATRTPGIKIFIGSSTGNLLVDKQAALESIFKNTTLPICAHCEDETTVQNNMLKYAGSTDVATHSRIRNHEAALIATRRAIDLAIKYEHHFHVLHVSTAQEIAEIKRGGQWVSAEVCPHHLFFNVDDYPRLGSLIKMNPSIKNKEDNEQLWQALLDGVITVIATDHAPHTLEEKRLPYPDCPSGLPAVENSLALILNQVVAGKCTLGQVANWMSAEPAKIWKMKNKGQIQVGFDADLTLVDLDLKQTITNENQETKCGWSPWAGTELTGWPVATWVMGHQAFRIHEGNPQFDASQLGREVLFESTS